jgi:inorganic pyrophosphatase
MHSLGIAGLPAFQPKTNLLNVVIETPLGASVKLKYDDEAGVFRAHKAMPVGFQFPFNFGFVPATRAEDGDPLDVLVLSSHALTIGTVVLGQIAAVLEAVQVEGKERSRNDRVIAIPWDTVSDGPMLPEIFLDQKLKDAITGFFSKYNEAQGKTFPATAVCARSPRHANRQTSRKGSEGLERRSCWRKSLGMLLKTEKVQKSIIRLRKFLKKKPKSPAPEKVHKIRTSARRLESSLEAMNVGKKD